LAAITIVAFNGVQNRGKTAAGQSLASSVAKKAEAYNSARTTGNGYPTHTELTAATSAVGEAQLDAPAAVLSTAVDVSTALGGKAVSYTNQSTTGACVGYWDYSVSSANLKYIKVGTGASGTC
ncbi:hypothetical protein I8H89_04150, partial [Candidatus Saccharibacteria bacterium]|nr:hypothetical protein [Candidatus Saccharibacteria bacterium]